jgi:hypothetical protein
MALFKPMPLTRKETIWVLTNPMAIWLLPDELLVDIGRYLKFDPFILTSKSALSDGINIRVDEIEGEAYTHRDYTFLEELLTYVSCEFLFLPPETIQNLRNSIKPFFLGAI